MPDRRFAMIALEMDAEDGLLPAPSCPDPMALRWNDLELVCPRCGLSAFEPSIDRDVNGFVGVPSVICLGCPDRPWYPLPPGDTRLNSETYRCQGCGVFRQVTMTMSDVNLHCSGSCKRLTLHVRKDFYEQRNGLTGRVDFTQIPVLTAATNKLTSPMMVQTSNISSMYSLVTLVLDADDRWPTVVDAASVRMMEDRERQPTIMYKSRVIMCEEYGDVLNAIDANKRDQLIETMMSILGLEDFDAYAKRKRADNTAPWRDQDRNTRIGLSAERGTGRTMRGIIELLALCNLSNTSQVWVLSADSRLYREVTITRSRLGNTDPRMVNPVPDKTRLIENGLRPPFGVALLVDHTYYERQRTR